MWLLRVGDDLVIMKLTEVPSIVEIDVLTVAVSIDFLLEHLFKSTSLLIFCINLLVDFVPSDDTLAVMIIANMCTSPHASSIHLFALLLIRATVVKVHFCHRAKHTDKAVIGILVGTAEANSVAAVALETLKDGLNVVIAIAALPLGLICCTTHASTASLTIGPGSKFVLSGVRAIPLENFVEKRSHLFVGW